MIQRNALEKLFTVVIPLKAHNVLSNMEDEDIDEFEHLVTEMLLNTDTMVGGGGGAEYYGGCFFGGF